jgi:hypothetical protein
MNRNFSCNHVFEPGRREGQAIALALRIQGGAPFSTRLMRRMEASHSAEMPSSKFPDAPRSFASLPTAISPWIAQGNVAFDGGVASIALRTLPHR